MNLKYSFITIIFCWLPFSIFADYQVVLVNGYSSGQTFFSVPNDGKYCIYSVSPTSGGVSKSPGTVVTINTSSGPLCLFPSYITFDITNMTKQGKQTQSFVLKLINGIFLQSATNPKLTVQKDSSKKATVEVIQMPTS